MTLQEYISKLNTLYQTGNAREHSYRGDLQNLLMSILPDVLVTNEPARVECGAPDYVLTRKDIPLGYIEAKDIGVNLKDKKLKEQFDRYKSGLSNLIITDYLEFQFYKDGKHITGITIAKLENGQIVPQPEHFKEFIDLIKNFSETISQSIKSPTRLAQMMAGKARLMADIIEKSLNNDDKFEKRSNIKSQMLSFQQMLIHDIDNKGFSDIYAQTIAYGMFAARYHDPTLEDFSRTEAAQLIPKSNPFLRKLFQDIAGYDLDDRLVWIVDELVSIFLASDVAEIMKNFGKSTKQEDPVVHFYETFLGEYSPALRKARGVWYTPQPVVSFIVRSVDEILKTEFDLPQGLADTSKIKIKKKAYTKATADSRSKLKEVVMEEEVHRVQILDPATGTGTFLAEVVKQIYAKFKGQQGIWSNYVKKDLIPRLNGFELLMASYAMAHLKLDMLLTETGVQLSDEQRFRIYLTNSLEEAHPDTGTLFSSWLSDEADQANAIKKDTPVMCVIGNPPYSASSSNKSDWIESLTSDYKRDLNEKSYNSLSDDYVKFIRFGQYFIDRNESGVLAYISNNSFIDGLTHRQMRKNLLESFDKTYIMDLHGNSKKKEQSPNGTPDENVFDIMQGVSINIFIKTGRKAKKDLGKVFHHDLYGKRKLKYDFLNDRSLSSINWTSLERTKPNYFFTKKDFKGKEIYEKGFSITDLFVIKAAGIKTHRDSVVIGHSQTELKRQIESFLDDSSIKAQFEANKIKSIMYRPFDKRLIYYDTDLVERHRLNQIKHSFEDNYSLISGRQTKNREVNHFFITSTLSEMKTGESSTGSYHFPIYLYYDIKNKKKIAVSEARQPNFNKNIVEQISKGNGLIFKNEKDNDENTFAPIDILDYIYAVLHSPSYRERYKEFLKIDFPRVPVPPDHVVFWKLVNLGSELRQIHLLDSPIVEKFITKYPVDGDNIVGKPRFEMYDYSNEIPDENGNLNYPDYLGAVYINDTQYFADVPTSAWEFYIGGYQPAQKWLKDRKGRELSYEDILHYQKIIVALYETNRLMKEIDKIKIV